MIRAAAMFAVGVAVGRRARRVNGDIFWTAATLLVFLMFPDTNRDAFYDS